MDIKREKLIQNTKSLLEYKKMNSNSLFVKSLMYLKPTCSRVVISIILFIFTFLMLKFYVFKIISALALTAELTQQINIILLPIFAVIITGYAIFQGLVNGKTLILLTGIDHEKNGSKFEVYNLYFFGLACVYLIGIISNNFLLLMSSILPDEFYISLLSDYTNEVISAVLLSVYIVAIFNLLLNMKNFVYNLFQVFITNGTVNVIDGLKNGTNKDDQPEA